MARYQIRPLSLAALTFITGAVAPGCVNTEGQPWGVLDLKAYVAFDPAAEALDEDSRLITPYYAIEIEDIEMAVPWVSVNQAEDSTAGFDPANPPEGYSLCHNGHCHSASGDLVDYEDIASELAAQGVGGNSLTLLSIDDGLFQLDATERSLTLEACDPCTLQRGTVSGVQAGVSHLHLKARVYDRDQGSAFELPDEGVAFIFDAPLDVVATAPADAPIERGLPLGLAVSASINPGDTFLGGVDFAQIDTIVTADADTVVDLSDNEVMAASLTERLGEISLTISYFEVTL